MVAHQLDSSGSCNTCNTVANVQHILICYGCKTHIHSECQNIATYGTKSFLTAFNKLRNNNNFLFVCDLCITKWENKEASTLKDQMAEVVESVARLTKGVLELKSTKKDESTNAVSPTESKNTEKVIPTAGAPKPAPWSDPKHISKITHDKSKVTLCIKNDNTDNTKIDVAKVKEVITSNGIQITKASVNQKNGDLYVQLPTDEHRDKLVDQLKNGTIAGNTIVNVKAKCPVITIRNIPYAGE